MSNGLKDLKLWQEATALAADAVRLARTAARRETRAFTDRLALTALAVAERVAEGHAGREAAEQHRAFAAARLTLAELETQLAVARLAGLTQATAHAQIAARLAAVSRLLAGYLGYLERQLAESRLASGAPVAARPEPAAGPPIDDA